MKKVFKVFTIDMISKLFAVISTLLIIRYMGTSDYAEYAIITSFIAIITGVLINGFNRIYIIEYNRIKYNQIDILIIQILIILILGFIASLISNTKYTSLLIILLLSTCIFHYVRTLYQQRCLFKTFALIDLIRVIIFNIFIFILTKRNTILHLNLTILFQSLALASALFFLAALMKRDKTIKITLDFKNILRILLEKEQFVLFLFFGFNAVLLQIDIMSLRFWSNDLMVASYSSAFKYYSLEMMVLETVNSIMLPEVNKEKSKITIKKLYDQHNIMTLVFGIGMLLAIIVAPIVIPLIDKGKYPDAVIVFRVLSVSAIISFAGSPYINYIMKEKEYVFAVINNISSIILAIIINYVFIKLWGAVGTALAALIVYGINNMFVRLYAKHLMNKEDT